MKNAKLFGQSSVNSISVLDFLSMYLVYVSTAALNVNR
jgi:hypothetical protein